MTVNENQVSKPPLQAPLIQPDGLMSRAWSIWFRNVYSRISYKGNPIDENQVNLEELYVLVEKNIEDIAANKLAIEANSDDILANTLSIIQNTLAIAENADDIADNADAIALNITNIANNAQAILDLEYRVLGDTRPGIYQESGVSYSQGDYIVNPSSDPQKYFAAREDIADPAGPFDSSKWGEISLKTIRQAIVDELVYAAYGAIGVTAQNSLGIIDSTFKNITGYDTNRVAVPKDVTYHKNSDGMRLRVVGVWMLNVNVALSFTDVNSGRVLYIRAYNDSSGVAGNGYPIYIGRNQDGGNMSVNIPFELDEATKDDLIVLQLGTLGDTFNSVVNLGTSYSVNHISEAKFI